MLTCWPSKNLKYFYSHWTPLISMPILHIVTHSSHHFHMTRVKLDNDEMCCHNSFYLHKLFEQKPKQKQTKTHQQRKTIIFVCVCQYVFMHTAGFHIGRKCDRLPIVFIHFKNLNLYYTVYHFVFSSVFKYDLSKFDWINDRETLLVRMRALGTQNYYKQNFIFILFV